MTTGKKMQASCVPKMGHKLPIYLITVKYIYYQGRKQMPLFKYLSIPTYDKNATKIDYVYIISTFNDTAIIFIILRFLR